jgi:hypothetical protein
MSDTVADIELFLRYCHTSLEIDKSRLFAAPDLFYATNMVAVVNGLCEFARVAQQRSESAKLVRAVFSLPRPQFLSAAQIQALPSDAIHFAVKYLQPHLNTIVWWPQSEPLEL